MSVPAKERTAEPITPAVHLEFIQNQAALADGAGIEAVEAYHRALFLHHHARELEACQQQARIHEDRLVWLEKHLARTHEKLSGLEKLIPAQAGGEADLQGAAPWSVWDGVMFGAAGLSALALLVFGVLNVSFNLLESGLVTFAENPIRAYFWSALLPVGAFAVKAGWDLLPGGRSRPIYLWTCFAIGIAGVLAWVAAYSAVYPILSKTTAETIASLSVFDSGKPPSASLLGMNSAGVKWVDAITVAAQAAAELFLSAALGIYMTMLHGKHRSGCLAPNPMFAQWDRNRQRLEERIAAERLALAEARGQHSRIENQLAALLHFARSIFQKEAASQRDQCHQKHLLLGKISEQLRSELERVEPTGNGAGRTRESAAAG